MIDLSRWSSYFKGNTQGDPFNKYNDDREKAGDKRSQYTKNYSTSNASNPLNELFGSEGLFADEDQEDFGDYEDFFNIGSSQNKFMKDGDSSIWDFENTGKWNVSSRNDTSQARVGNNKTLWGRSGGTAEQKFLGHNNTGYALGREGVSQFAKGFGNEIHGWSTEGDVNQFISGFRNRVEGFSDNGAVNQKTDGKYNFWNEFWAKGLEVFQDITGVGNKLRAKGDDIKQNMKGDEFDALAKGINIEQILEGNFSLIEAEGESIKQTVKGGKHNTVIAKGDEANITIDDKAQDTTVKSYADNTRIKAGKGDENLFFIAGEIDGGDGNNYFDIMKGTGSGTIKAGSGDDLVFFGDGLAADSSWSLDLGAGDDKAVVDHKKNKGGEVKFGGGAGDDSLVLEGAKIKKEDISITKDEKTGEYIIKVGKGDDAPTYRTKDVEHLTYTDEKGKKQTIDIKGTSTENPDVILGSNDPKNPDHLNLRGKEDLSKKTVDLQDGDDSVYISGKSKIDGLTVKGGNGEDTVNLEDADSGSVKVTKNADGKYTVSFKDKDGKEKSFTTDSVENLSVNKEPAKSLEDWAKETGSKVITGSNDPTNPDNLNLRGKEDLSNTTVDLQDGDDSVYISGKSKIDGLTVKGGNGEDTVNLEDADPGSVKVTKNADGKYTVSFKDKDGKEKSFTTDSVENLSVNKEPAKSLEDWAKETGSKVITGSNDPTNPDNLNLRGKEDLSNTTVDLQDGDDSVYISGKSKVDGLTVKGGNGEDTVNLEDADPGSVKVTKNADGKYTVSFKKDGKEKSFTTDSVENLSVNKEPAKSLEDWAKETDKEIIEGRDDENNGDKLNLRGKEDLSDTIVDLKKGDDNVYISGKSKMDGLEIHGGEGEDTVNLEDADPGSVKVTKNADGKYTVSFKKDGKEKSFTTDSVENLSVNKEPAKSLDDWVKDTEKQVIEGRDDENNGDKLNLRGKEDLSNTIVDMKKGDDDVYISGKSKMDGLEIHGGEGEDTVNLEDVDPASVKVEKTADGKYTVSFKDKEGNEKSFTTDSVENLSINGEPAKKIDDWIKNSKVIEGTDDNDTLNLRCKEDLSGTTVDMKKGDDNLYLSGKSKMDGLNIIGGDGNDTIKLEDVDPASVKVEKTADGKYTVSFKDKEGNEKSFTTDSVENLSINGEPAKKIDDWIKNSKVIEGTDDNDTLNLRCKEDLSGTTVDMKKGDDNLYLSGKSKMDGLNIIGGDGNDTIKLEDVDPASVKVEKTADGKYTVSFKDKEGNEKSFTTDSVENLSVNGGPVKKMDDWTKNSKVIEGTDDDDKLNLRNKKDLSDTTVQLKEGDDSVALDGRSEMEGLVIDGGDGKDTVKINNVEPGTVKVVKNDNGTYTVSFTDKEGNEKSFTADSVENLKINGSPARSMDDWAKDTQEGRKYIGGSDNPRRPDHLDLHGKKDLSDTLVDLKRGDDTVALSGNSKMEGLVIDGGDGTDTVALKDIDKDSVKVVKNDNGTYTISFTDKAGNDKSFVTNDVENLSINGAKAKPLSEWCHGRDDRTKEYLEKGTFDDKYLNDIKEKIKTGKFSGGILEASKELHNIADALRAAGKTEQADKIQKLADLSENIGLIQKMLQDYVTGLNGATPDDNKVFTKPAGFHDDVSKFPENATFGELFGSGGLGFFSAVKAGTRELPDGFNKEESAAYQFIETFNELLGDSALGANVKNLLKQSTHIIGTIGEQADDIFWATRHPEFAGRNDVTGYIYDPLTGARSWPIMDFTNSSPFKFFMNYDGSGLFLP